MGRVEVFKRACSSYVVPATEHFGNLLKVTGAIQHACRLQYENILSLKKSLNVRYKRPSTSKKRHTQQCSSTICSTSKLVLAKYNKKSHRNYAKTPAFVFPVQPTFNRYFKPQKGNISPWYWLSIDGSVTCGASEHFHDHNMGLKLCSKEEARGI